MSTYWNPRYVLYAKAHGRSPEAMKKHDDTRWPGGRMAGFMVWISQRWVEWRKARNCDKPYLSRADH